MCLMENYFGSMQSRWTIKTFPGGKSLVLLFFYTKWRAQTFPHWTFSSVFHSASPLTAPARISGRPPAACQPFTRLHPVWSNKETSVSCSYHQQLTHFPLRWLRTEWAPPAQRSTGLTPPPAVLHLLLGCVLYLCEQILKWDSAQQKHLQIKSDGSVPAHAVSAVCTSEGLQLSEDFHRKLTAPPHDKHHLLWT